MRKNIALLTRETNEFQRVLTLQTNRNKRHRYQEFVIEGRFAIEEAWKRGWKIRSIFFSKDRAMPAWAENYLAQGAYDTAYALTDQLMDKISDKTESAEIVAIVEQPLRSFMSYQPKSRDVVVVLDEPKSPGNLGMMIRSSVAFGAPTIIISGHGADEFDPQCIRASRGTFFSASIYRVEGIKSFVSRLEAWKKNGDSIQVIATGDRGSMPLENAKLDADILFLVLGNETHGLSVGYRELSDQFVQIQLEGEFSSLNIAAAGSIFLYEIFRQRKIKGYE
jgi:23S rRNA (uridine2479-2'-O)-methyltransferase